jgi:hypothetical protein
MKKYVIRVLRNDGSLYDERFEYYNDDSQARTDFNGWWLFWGNTEYSYELRRYYKNGNTGKKVICSHYNVNYQG